MLTARSSSRGGGVMVSTRPLLLPCGVVALWCDLPPPRRPYQKATKPEGHNRPQQKAISPPPPQSRPPQGADPPGPGPPAARHSGIPPAMHTGIAPPQETCCKACWDTTCNACWDSTPPLTESETPVKTLLCPNFFAGVNKKQKI